MKATDFIKDVGNVDVANAYPKGASVTEDGYSVAVEGLVEFSAVQRVMCVVIDRPGSNLAKALENHERLIEKLSSIRPVTPVDRFSVERSDISDDVDIEQQPLAVVQAIGVESIHHIGVGNQLAITNHDKFLDNGERCSSRNTFIADVVIHTTDAGHRLVRSRSFSSGVSVLLD